MPQSSLLRRHGDVSTHAWSLHAPRPAPHFNLYGGRHLVARRRTAGTSSHDGERPAPRTAASTPRTAALSPCHPHVMLVLRDHLWLAGCMTVLVTRRHVDYVRVTTTSCSAVS